MPGADFMAHELHQPPSASDVMNLKDMLEASDIEAETRKREEKLKLANEIFEDPEVKEEEANLDNWLAEVQAKDNMLRKASEIKKVVPADKLPPVRNAGKKERRIQEGPSDVEIEKKGEAKRVPSKKNQKYYSYDYFKEWDKFDVDQELERIEAEEKKREEFKTFSKTAVDFGEEVHDPNKTYDIEGMTSLERRMAAQREKEKGNECMKCGEINAAVAYYSKALELRPGDHLVLGNRAQAYIGIHCYYQAELDCDQALAIESAYTKARYRRAVAKEAQGKHAEAIADLEAVLGEQPDNAAAAQLLEKTRRKAEKKEKDAQRKREEEEERRQYEAAPRRKIEILEDSDEEEEEEGEDGLDSKALEQARAAIKAKEEKERGEREAKEEKERGEREAKEEKERGEREAKAREEAEAGRLKGAAEERLMRVEEARREKQRGNESFKSKALAAAEAAYGRALALLEGRGEEDGELGHEAALVLSNRALVRIQQRRFAEAEADCAAAIAADPKWAKAHHRRGVARAGQGKLEEAMEDLEGALRLEPESSSTLDEIRRVKQLQAQKRQAQQQQQQPSGSTRRVQIEEIESDEEEEAAAPVKQAPPSRKVQVVEVEDESEEEEEGEEVGAEDDGMVMEDEAVASAGPGAGVARRVAITEVEDDDSEEGEVVESEATASGRVEAAGAGGGSRRVVIEEAEEESSSGDEWVQVHSPSKAKGPEAAPAQSARAEEAAKGKGAQAVGEGKGAEKAEAAAAEEEEEGAKPLGAAWEQRAGVDEERMLRAKRLKEEGDAAFRKGMFEAGVEGYTAALAEVEGEGWEAEQLVCLLNRAACFLQTRDYPPVIADCAQALSLDPDSVKALVRRGLAYEGMERPAKAAADMRAALSVEFAAGQAQSPMAAKARECLERCKRLDPSLKAIPIPVRAPRPRAPAPADVPVVVPAQAAPAGGGGEGKKEEKKETAKEEVAKEEVKEKEEKKEEKKLTLREQLLGGKARQAPQKQGGAGEEGARRGEKGSEAVGEKVALKGEGGQGAAAAKGEPEPKEEEKKEEKKEEEKEEKKEGGAGKTEEEGAAARREDASKAAQRAEAEEHKNRGNKAFKEGKFKAAVMHYSAAIDLDDGSALFHTNLAAAHHALKDFANALRMADKASRLDARYPKAHYRRAQALQGLGRLEEAVAAFDAGLALLPESVQMREGKAAAQTELRAQKEAPANALAAIKEKLQAREALEAAAVKEAAAAARANQAHAPAPASAGAAKPGGGVGAPKTVPEFKRGMKNLRKDSQALYAFLTLIEPPQLPKLLSSGVEEEELVEVARVLEAHGVEADAVHAFRMLEALGKVPRASIVCAMLDRKDAKLLETLILKLHPAKTGAAAYDVKAWADMRKALGV